MNICYLGLGSNQKCPERQLKHAIEAIAALPKTTVKKISSNYRTKAWGLQRQQDFCNAVIEIHTLLQPLALMKACQRIEKKQGRIRKKRWGPRIIDIDILIYADRRLKSQQLTIPHPHIHSREFVFLPLNEIRPPQ